MDRNQALKLICDAADKARRNSDISASDRMALDLLAWTQRNIERYGVGHACGVASGASRMFSHCVPAITPEISTAFFVVEEVTKHDGVIPAHQVREVASKLAALGEKQAA
jgi:hypothetical protein